MFIRQKMSGVQHEALNPMNICRALNVPRFFIGETTISSIVYTWFLGHVYQCNSNSMHLIALHKAHRKCGCHCNSKSSQINVRLTQQSTSLAPEETKNSEASTKPQSTNYKCSSIVVVKITWPPTKMKMTFTEKKHNRCKKCTRS